MSADTLPVIYLEAPADGEKGIFGTARAAAAHVGDLPVEALIANLSAVCAKLSAVFGAAEHAADAFDLDCFEVTLDLTASGEVRLIGSVSTQVHGGLKLTFRRRGEPPA